MANRDDDDVPDIAEHPVEIEIRVEKINQFSYFHKFSYEYSIELSFNKTPLLTIHPDEGKFYVCPFIAQTPSEENLVENVDEAELNFPYSITLNSNDLNDLNKLADCPVFIVLYIYQPEGWEEFLENSLLGKGSGLLSKEDGSGSDFVETYKKNVKIMAEEKPKKTLSKTLFQNKQYTEDAEGSPEEETMHKFPIGYGFIHLLHLISKNKTDSVHKVYLYPEFIHSSVRTPYVTVRLKTVEGILENNDIKFCNLACITLESVYNLTEKIELNDKSVDVDFILIQDNLEEHKLMTFSGGTRLPYGEQDQYKAWDNLPSVRSIGTKTALTVEKGFRGLYCEDADIDISAIGPTILLYNSIHVWLLTRETCLNLEHVVGSSPMHLAIELRVDGEESSYIGFIDLAPMLYPDVQNGRFAVSLKDALIDAKTQERYPRQTSYALTKTLSKLSAKFSTTTIGSFAKKLHSQPPGYSDEEPGQMFLIFQIDLNKPITENAEDNRSDLMKLVSHIGAQDIQPVITNTYELYCKAQEEFENHIISIIKELPEYVSAGELVFMEDASKLVEAQWFDNMKANLMDILLKLTAAKYNIERPTSSNVEFKELMTTVYNDLHLKVDKIVNDYFAGCNNFIDLNAVEKFHDITIFLARECEALEFDYIVENVWQKIRDDAEQNESFIIDLAINELEEGDFDEASHFVDKLLRFNRGNFHGLLIKTYIKYIQSNELDEWFPDLLTVTKECPQQVEGWALLYVIFKGVEYRPGYKQSRMNLTLRYPPEKYEYFWNRHELYFEVKDSTNPLHYSMYIFIKMALYDFAELLFDFCREDFSAIDRTELKCSLFYLKKQYLELSQYLDDLPKNEENLILINTFKGHLHYRGRHQETAIHVYEITYHLPKVIKYNHVAFLRCGYWYLNEKTYDVARTYFSTCCKESNSFLSWYGLGICYYRINQIVEAELAFAKASNLCSTVAELWIYLTLTNLKLRDNVKAQTCYSLAAKYVLQDQDLWNEMLEEFKICEIKTPPKF